MSKYVKGEEIKKICGTVITTSTVGTGTQNINFFWADLALNTTPTYISIPEVKAIRLNGKTTDSTATVSPINYAELQYDPTNYCIKFAIITD